jgi:lipopolysaccharide/colanic/teichoic acid biosynthesis glycosyltransferase
MAIYSTTAYQASATDTATQYERHMDVLPHYNQVLIIIIILLIVIIIIIIISSTHGLPLKRQWYLCLSSSTTDIIKSERGHVGEYSLDARYSDVDDDYDTNDDVDDEDEASIVSISDKYNDTLSYYIYLYQ